MFQLQDKTEEEDAMSLEMESIKAKFERLQLQADLELKEKEMLKEKLNKMQMMQKEEELKVKTDEGTAKEKNYDKLVGLLKGVIQKGEQSEKPGLDKAWDEICEILDFCREQPFPGKTINIEKLKKENSKGDKMVSDVSAGISVQEKKASE